MTRDEEVRNAIDTIIPIFRSNNGRTYEQALMASGFEAGVKWADAHPKSTWISVKEDLPCNHQELMKNEYFTVRVFLFTVNKDIRTDSMVKESSGWKWVNAEFNYRYWMPMPELPKE